MAFKPINLLDKLNLFKDLQRSEMFVVPKGVKHKPYAQDECHIMLVEPAGTLNTGDAGGARTLEQDIWI